MRDQIVIVNLDPTIGHEIQKTRPCLIVSPDEMNTVLSTVMIVPLTSVERKIPTRVLISASEKSGLVKNSYAVLDQLKTVDKMRIQKVIGEISPAEKEQISRILIEMFTR